jgi:hypothetical protein
METEYCGIDIMAVNNSLLTGGIFGVAAQCFLTKENDQESSATRSQED